MEVLAIIESLTKFKNDLLGTKFKIVNYCAVFQKTLIKKELDPKVSTLTLFIEEFDYEIVHRAGNKMKCVNVLSCNTIFVITCSRSEVTTRIAVAWEKSK